PYVETLNGNYENVIFAIDLNKTPYLIERLKSLREGDLYLVKNALSDKTLFLAERVGNLIKIKHEVEFRHITMDASRAKKGKRMWYRNGVVMKMVRFSQMDSLLLVWTQQNFPNKLFKSDSQRVAFSLCVGLSD
ncbi:TPA: hypothetical protein ACPHR2_004604, partial [Vibrio antiquarius]